ncbi:MAG: hypothetical protein J5787_04675 [Alphaproteobacteria bacterium]|nr:hypothetical protein [Alphaproteobacteria bacterium]
MKKLLILFVLGLLMNMSVAFAQVIDMRELSRRRGFASYKPQPLQSQTVHQQQPDYAEKPRSQTKAVSFSGRKDQQMSVKAVDQTEEMQQYIADNPRVKPDI